MAAFLLRTKILNSMKNRNITVRNTISMSHIFNQSTVSAELTVNHDIHIDPKVESALQDEEIESPKKHPGILNLKAVVLPEKLTKAVNTVIENYPTPNLKTESEKLARYLWSRALPISDSQLTEIAKQFQSKIISDENIDISTLPTEERMDTEDRVKKKVLSTMRYHVYHWKSIHYDAYKSLLYMVGRLASDYCSLYRVLHEIEARDPQFRPKTMFDFGSGVGTSIWVANTIWPKVIYEHYCVDVAVDMNTLARLILQGGEEEADMCYNGVYFRQYNPFTSENLYDLVICAFSLMEIPTQQERLKTLLSLWEKTDKYLVLIENGTNSGFSLISEARDFILQCGMKQEDLKGHVFAPCPHDYLCPRGLRNDGTPCNFEQTYKLLDINKGHKEHSVTRFSYAILCKGERDTSVPQWPRVVRQVSTPSKRVHCRTCTTGGELQISILTQAKHGRNLYRCAKATKWGDLLPVISSKKSTDTNEYNVKKDINDNCDTKSSPKRGDFREYFHSDDSVNESINGNT